MWQIPRLKAEWRPGQMCYVAMVTALPATKVSMVTVTVHLYSYRSIKQEHTM